MKTNLSALTCLLAALSGTSVRCPTAEAAKPNIVFILADDKY